MQCRQGTTTTQLNLSPDTIEIQCETACLITIDAATGAPGDGPGLEALIISGTAECASVHVVATASNGTTISVNAPVANEQWSAVMTEAAQPGVGTSLKRFRCDGVIDVTVTCNDENGCSAEATLTVSCDEDCFFDASAQVTRLSDGKELGTPNPTCDDSGSGEYALSVHGANGSTVTVTRWRESSSITDDSTILQDAAGNDVTSNPLTVTIEYPPGEAVSYTYTALARDAEGCIGVASATFSCGGGETQPNGPIDIDCEVSDWSRWSRCVDGVQRRTRTIITQPQNGGAPCPPLEETRTCPPEEEVNICDACCIWNWINIGLFVLTAIFIMVTFCTLEATAVSAILALGSGGTLAAVFAALSTANIIMLWICLGLLLLGLLSWLLWLIFCVANNPNACGMLATLNIVLSAITLLSAGLIIILLAIEMFGCLAGALINFGWFGMILAITTLIYAALGCLDRQ